MKILLPGGSGQIGTMLARAFHKNGHEVVVLGRSKKDAPWRFILWDGKNLDSWANELEGSDVIINLAGRSVNCRYDAKNQQEIMQSRIDSTKVIGEAIAKTKTPPKVWLQSSTATIYAHRYDAANDEKTGIIGGANPEAPPKWTFSINVAKAWERTLDEADTPHTRKVKLRSAMVMSPDKAGVFDTLLGLVHYGLGGKAGNGQQYVSWIHEQDFINALYWLIAKEDLNDVVNIAAPSPLPNAEFMRVLRETWGMPFGLAAANWMLALGAFFMRTETELILKSRRVVPTRLLESGFQFQYPNWPEAAQELCERWGKK